jgi:hypothetical protein
LKKGGKYEKADDIVFGIVGDAGGGLQ